jgi:translation initiation factor IF-2
MQSAAHRTAPRSRIVRSVRPAISSRPVARQPWSRRPGSVPAPAPAPAVASVPPIRSGRGQALGGPPAPAAGPPSPAPCSPSHAAAAASGRSLPQRSPLRCPPVRRVSSCRRPARAPRTPRPPEGAARRPIFERPRPGAPGTPQRSRPLAPGARRPMHPTRTFPGGPGGAPGAPAAAPAFQRAPALEPRPGFGTRTSRWHRPRRPAAAN